MKDYVITVNGEEIALTKGDVDALNCIKVDDARFHLLENHIANDIQVIDSDFLNKTLNLSVNGTRYTVHIADGYDLQVKKMGLLAASTQKVNSVKAPMPGLIVDILVKVGQEISEGTPLLVLSAMKMENIILSQGEGVVRSIEVNKEDTVEKGQLIIEME